MGKKLRKSRFSTIHFLRVFLIKSRNLWNPLFQSVTRHSTYNIKYSINFPRIHHIYIPYIRSINYSTTILPKRKKGKRKTKILSKLISHPLQLPRSYNSDLTVHRASSPPKRIYIYMRAARGQGSQLPPVRSSSATATLRNIPLCTYPVALLRDSLIARRVRADANHSPRPAKVTLSARKIKESRGATLASSLAYSLALSRATYGPLVISLRRD